jgi:hypothetical protein
MNSALLRIAFHTDAASPSPAPAEATPSPGEPEQDETGVSFGTLAVLAGFIAVVVIAITVARRRSRP